MIRITQTYLIKRTMEFYKSRDWITLYYDYPSGQRSGVGLRSKINNIWEGVYNLSPDLLFQKNGEIRLIEVDLSLNSGYVEKFIKYKLREQYLIEKLAEFVGPITFISYGFVARNKRARLNIDKKLLPFYFYRFTDNEFKEEVITTS